MGRVDCEEGASVVLGKPAELYQALNLVAEWKVGTCEGDLLLLLPLDSSRRNTRDPDFLRIRHSQVPRHLLALAVHQRY